LHTPIALTGPASLHRLHQRALELLLEILRQRPGLGQPRVDTGRVCKQGRKEQDRKRHIPHGNLIFRNDRWTERSE
jgi:hypothetical protein